MYIVTAWFGFRTNHRLSRSPSLLISGSDSWPLREGRALALLLAFAAEKIKNLLLTLCNREKNWARLVGKSRQTRVRREMGYLSFDLVQASCVRRFIIYFSIFNSRILFSSKRFFSFFQPVDLASNTELAKLREIEKEKEDLMDEGDFLEYKVSWNITDLQMRHRVISTAVMLVLSRSHI